MLKTLMQKALLGSLSVTLVACGGGKSNGSSTEGTANNIPVSISGENQNVIAGQTVNLDGSLSSDSDGDNLSYEWTIYSKPSGSKAQLSNINSVKPTFTPDLEGEYKIRLVVDDGTDKSLFDETVINATTTNSVPVANAGSNREANTYEIVYLDGSKSLDANGDRLTYSWSFVARPEGSNSVLENKDNKLSSFTPDTDGNYTVRLIVDDGQSSSIPDNVLITATTANSQPLANAGEDQVQFELSEIILDASDSSDVDGDQLYYQWSIQSAPDGSSIGLSGASSITTTLTPDLYGDYVFNLIVNDGQTDSLTDSVVVQVISPEQKQSYLADNLNAYLSSSSESSVNGYAQSGSKYTLTVKNNNSQTIDWTKFEARDADNSLFASTTDSGVLSNGSLTSEEISSIEITLSSSQRKPFTATFFWSDPLDEDKTFQTTLEFANN